MSTARTTGVANPRRTRLAVTAHPGCTVKNATKPKSPLIAMMIDYFAKRGRDIPTSTTGNKVVEEAGELREALAEDDELHAMHELGDVFISATAVAYRRGWTPEECIAAKIAKDTGRDARDAAKRAAKVAKKGKSVA